VQEGGQKESHREIAGHVGHHTFSLNIHGQKDKEKESAMHKETASAGTDMPKTTTTTTHTSASQTSSRV
jgi:hypothetical protein